MPSLRSPYLNRSSIDLSPPKWADISLYPGISVLTKKCLAFSNA